MSNATLVQGNSLDALKALPDCSVDSIVTDPPYELGFMGKAWDASGIAYSVELWRECLRVLKPGGHLLAFSGSRTYHRMTCAIEDAGFDIRDQIMWIYGSGFPKSLDVSKAIDKAAGAERPVVGSWKPTGTARPSKGGSHSCAKTTADCGYDPDTDARVAITAPATEAAKTWNGWGTALKPAHEPICVARKPLSGTVAANVLAHGVGALNIDGGRIHTEGSEAKEYTVKRLKPGATLVKTGGNWRPEDGEVFNGETKAGRWPANVILDEDAGAVLDGQTGEATSRFFYCPKASRKDRDEGLGAFPLRTGGGMSGTADGSLKTGAGNDRNNQVRNDHPTVKPTDLMRYLVRLVTPKGGLVLDPFMGSGSTGKAAMLEGMRFYGIDLDPHHVEIAQGRIDAVDPDRFSLAA